MSQLWQWPWEKDKGLRERETERERERKRRCARTDRHRDGLTSFKSQYFCWALGPMCPCSAEAWASSFPLPHSKRWGQNKTKASFAVHVTSNPWSKLTQACEAWATAALNSEGAEWLSGKDGHKSVQTLTLNTRDSDNINVFLWNPGSRCTRQY